MKWADKLNLGRIRGRLPKARTAAASVAAGVVLAGCNPVYLVTGEVLKAYSTAHVIPYTLEGSDLDMSCAMSEALTPLLMSFGRVTWDPNQIAVVVYQASGGCAESRAVEYELESMAALRSMDGPGSQDATIRQKRMLAVAAARYYESWTRFNYYYGEPVEGECPSLGGEQDQFIYMIGLLAGLQALNAEVQSTTNLGVPKNLGSIVGSAVKCLDNEDWWGAPNALEATIWAMLPGATPDNEDPFERLAESVEMGDEAGVRIARVFQIIAATNRGDEELVRQAIREHAESLRETPSDEEWMLVDTIATEMVLSYSDRLWMENTGHRTPNGQLGQFWDDQEDDPLEDMDIDLDNLL